MSSSTPTRNQTSTSLNNQNAGKTLKRKRNSQSTHEPDPDTYSENEEEEEEEEEPEDGEDLDDENLAKADWKDLHQKKDEDVTMEDIEFIAQEEEDGDGDEEEPPLHLQHLLEEEKKDQESLAKQISRYENTDPSQLREYEEDYEEENEDDEGEEEDLGGGLNSPLNLPQSYRRSQKKHSTTTSSTSSSSSSSFVSSLPEYSNLFSSYQPDMSDREVNELEEKIIETYEQYALILTDRRFLDEEYKDTPCMISYQDRQELLADVQSMKNEPGQVHDPTNTMFLKLLERCYMLDDAGELSVNRMFQLLKHLERKWTPLPSQTMAEFARARFGIDPHLNHSSIDVTALLNEQHKILRSEPMALLRLFSRRGWDTKDPNHKVCNRVLLDIFTRVHNYHQIIYNELSVLRSVRKQFIGSAPPFNPLMLRQESSIHYQGFNLFIDQLLRRLEQLGYQKKGPYIRKEKITADGKRTGFYEQTQTIEEWIYAETSSSSSNAAYKDAKLHIKKAAEYLEVCHDKAFPHYTPHRRVFSFRNGRYFADAEGLIDTFLTYEENEAYREVTSINYFDEDFNSFQEVGFDYTVLPDGGVKFETGETSTKEQIEQETPPPSWFHAIETPTFDEVLSKFQGWSDQKYKLFWAHVGRMLYPSGQMDNWEKFTFLIGLAGTGKSTIGKAIVETYENADIGVLSNKSEELFGLANIYGKLLTVCFEVKTDFNIGEAQFQSMCSGEYLGIAVKNSFSLQKKWDSTILLIGNEPPAWSNTSGAMKRRCSPFVFSRLVSKVDVNTRINQQIPKERAAILRKAIWGYLSTLAVLKNQPVDKLYTSEMVAWLDDLTDSTNSISSFLQQQILCSKLEENIKEKTFIPFSIFQKHYHSFLNENFVSKRKDLTSANYRHIFINHNLYVTQPLEANTKKYNGSLWNKREKWIIGADLSERIGKSAEAIKGSNPLVTSEELSKMEYDRFKKDYLSSHSHNASSSSSSSHSHTTTSTSSSSSSSSTSNSLRVNFFQNNDELGY